MEVRRRKALWAISKSDGGRPGVAVRIGENYAAKYAIV